MNFIEILDSDSTRWTKSFAEEMYDRNKDWEFSPAGALGWRMPVQPNLSEIVQLNWRVQNQVMQLVSSLEKFSVSSSPEDWMQAEKELDAIRCTVASMKRFSDEHLDEHLAEQSHSAPVMAAV